MENILPSLFVHEDLRVKFVHNDKQKLCHNARIYQLYNVMLIPYQQVDPWKMWQ